MSAVNVHLIPKAQAALDEITQMTGLSVADAVNHAVQLYATITAVRDMGGSVFIRGPHGETSTLNLTWDGS